MSARRWRLAARSPAYALPVDNLSLHIVNTRHAHGPGLLFSVRLEPHLANAGRARLLDAVGAPQPPMLLFVEIGATSGAELVSCKAVREDKETKKKKKKQKEKKKGGETENTSRSHARSS